MTKNLPVKEGVGRVSTSKEKGPAASSRAWKVWSASWTSASSVRTASTTLGL